MKNRQSKAERQP